MNATSLPSGDRVAWSKDANGAFAGDSSESRTTRASARGRKSTRPKAARAATAAAAAISQAVRSRLRRLKATGAATPAAEPPAIHWSSLAMSCALCHLSSGSLARQTLTTRSRAGGVIGWIVEIAGGSEDMMEEIRLAWLLPENAFLPVAIS